MVLMTNVVALFGTKFRLKPSPANTPVETFFNVKNDSEVTQVSQKSLNKKTSYQLANKGQADKEQNCVKYGRQNFTYF